MENNLNFVWIRGNNDYYDPRRTLSQSPIPAEYLNNALAQARANPSLAVSVWYDHVHLSGREEAFLQGLENKPSNLSVQRLRDIPTYKETTLFRKSGRAWNRRRNGVIWKQVDLARILVLHHVLRKKGAEKCFYSDFDIVKPDAMSSMVQDIIDRYGFLLSCFKDSDSRQASFYIENDFIGFHRTMADKIEEYFLSAIKESYKNKRTSNGWSSFYDCARRLCLHEKISLREVSLQFEPLWGNGPKNNFNKTLLVKGQNVPVGAELAPCPSFLKRLLPDGQQIFG